MTRFKAVILVLLLSSCRHSRDPKATTNDVVGNTSAADNVDRCPEYIGKLVPAMAKLPPPDGWSAPSAAKIAKGVKHCHDDPKVLLEPTAVCMLNAKDDAAVDDCATQWLKLWRANAKEVEGQFGLEILSDALKANAREYGKLIVGKAPLTPTVPCCQQAHQLCAPVAQDWATPIWQALFFKPENGESRFQFSYDSDGTTATLKAIGDMNCDGHSVEFVSHVTMNPATHEAVVSETERTMK